MILDPAAYSTLGDVTIGSGAWIIYTTSSLGNPYISNGTTTYNGVWDINNGVKQAIFRFDNLTLSGGTFSFDRSPVTDSDCGLALLATGTVTIDVALNLSGTAGSGVTPGRGGPGAEGGLSSYSTGGPTYSNNPPGGTRGDGAPGGPGDAIRYQGVGYGGGQGGLGSRGAGGGGGYGGAGGNGSASQTSSGSGGITYGDATGFAANGFDEFGLYGGSGGGSGNRGGGMGNAGGGGGGSLEIVALAGIVLQDGAQLLVNGGAGAGGGRQTGGGGSGGAIVLATRRSIILDPLAKVEAKGGAGGNTAVDGTSAGGGGGGGGLIGFYSTDIYSVTPTGVSLAGGAGGLYNADPTPDARDGQPGANGQFYDGPGLPRPGTLILLK